MTPVIPPHGWVKSSYSNEDGGNCIEYNRALLASGTIAVRDSKNTTGPILVLSDAAWTGLVELARNASA
ncbi:DUF397 domain-containing protein [Streptomyces sp. NPDC059396]|uniref:DUF397 domain-containing protein n=1 Tax=Streptomyces sp. NPDC059396 TaxID=3346819 RepID=UPI00367D9340